MKLESAEKMANELIQKYLSVEGLKDFYGKNNFHHIMGYDDVEIIKYLTEDWKFQFNDSRVNLGEVFYEEAIITLSSVFVKNVNKAFVYEALIHEIAHALCPFEGHNHIWKAICFCLGQTPFEQVLWGFPKERKKKVA